MTYPMIKLYFFCKFSFICNRNNGFLNSLLMFSRFENKKI